MKIVMTGGGSGGHITPVLAVAKEIKQHHPDAQIVYIGQRGDMFGEVVAENEMIDETFTVFAGKFRRYHGQGIKQFLDFHTMWLNITDAFRSLVGIVQSTILLAKIKPDVVFCKGGFVGVPVGLAAAIRRTPYVTHDSDAIPGLANRIIARWARVHAVALDPKLYPYPLDKTVSVGVPISHKYSKVESADKYAIKKSLGIEKYENILLVTGGGLGALRLNSAVVAGSLEILKAVPSTCIIHTSGQLHEASVSAEYSRVLSKDLRRQVIVRGFVDNLHQYSGTADVVVARGGATNFAELALQAKACIIVPNPMLTGGHQLKNALAYEKDNAIVCVQEKDIEKDSGILAKEIISLLKDKTKQAKLSSAIHKFARPNATKDLADILVNIANGESS